MGENPDIVEWKEGLVDKYNKVKVLSVINKIKFWKAIESDGLF